MESIISEILDRLRAGEELDAKVLLRILNDHNKRLDANVPHYSKKKLLPFYLRTKERDPQRWQSWNITPELEQQLVHLLQVKPRRARRRGHHHSYHQTVEVRRCVHLLSERPAHAQELSLR